MKVLMINGSPHKEGCTYTALKEVEKALAAEGIECEIMTIGKEAVHGCIGCGGCGKLGKCVFSEDSLNEAVEKMKEADGLIVGSPVYYASPNGTLISFMDRFFMSGGKHCVHKPAAAVVSARRAGTTASLEVITKYFQFAQMPVVSANYWNMVHGSCMEDVKKDEEGLQIMRTLGRNMAWMLKCIEAGKKEGIDAPETENKIKTNFIR